MYHVLKGNHTWHSHPFWGDVNTRPFWAPQPQERSSHHRDGDQTTMPLLVAPVEPVVPVVPVVAAVPEE